MATDPRTLYMKGFDPNHALSKRVISERALFSDDYDIPLTKITGGMNSAPGKFGISNITDLKYEWMYDGPLPIAAALGAAMGSPAVLGVDVNGNNVYASTTVAVTGVEYLHLGMVLDLPTPVGVDPDADSDIHTHELVWIEAIDYAAGTVTFKRGFGNTPVNAYDSGAKVSIIGTAGTETQGWVANYQTRRGVVEGYWQTFFAGWQDTEMRATFQSNYGDEGDELERNKRKILGGSLGGRAITGLLPLQLEMSLMYGQPFKGNPNVPLPSSFGGITSYPINKPVYNTTLTYANVQDALQTIYSNGGAVDLMVCSPAIKRIISGWAETNRETYGAQRTERDYGVKVDRILTDFGDLDIAMSRHMRANEFFLLDTTKIGLITGIDWTEAELPIQETPMLKRWMIYGVYGLILTHPTHHTWGRIDVSSLRYAGATNLYTEPAAVAQTWPGTVV